MKWISVKDKLPKDYKQIILAMRDEHELFSIAAFFRDGKFINLEDHDELYDVEFWMYLPEPPNQ